MKKYLRFFLFIFIFLISSFLFAQNDLSKINIRIKNADNFIIIPDSNGNICLFYQDVSNVFFTLVGPDYKVIRTRSYKRILSTQPNKPFLGATITDKAFILFFADSDFNKQHYSTYYISKVDTMDFKIDKSALLKTKDEKFIRSYTDHNIMYGITLNKKTKQLTFLKFINESEIKRYSYIISKRIYGYLKNSDFAIIKSTQNYTVPLVNPQRKMYVSEPGRIIFTVDNHSGNYGKEGFGNTKIFEFNFKKDTLNYYYTPAKAKMNGAYTNSFYYKEKIFKILILKEIIGLYVYDMKSGKLEKEYEYGKQTKIELISDKVLCKGKNTIFDNGEDIMDSNFKILNTLSIGKPSIAVKHYKGDTLMILIGSLEIINGGSGGGMMTSGMGSISTPRGNIPISTPTFSGTHGSGTTVTYTTWFNSFLQDSTYDIVPDLKDYPEFYKIENYKDLLKERKVKIDATAVFKINNRTYLGYFIRKENDFYIVEIL